MDSEERASEDAGELARVKVGGLCALDIERSHHDHRNAGNRGAGKRTSIQLWDQEGRPQGKDVEHYYRAKHMLEKREADAIVTDAKPTLMEQDKATRPGERHIDRRPSRTR